MALSKLQKGLVGLGIAVVAVIAVGYGGMRYLENAVVDAIRTWAAQTPQDAHVELGDISYTLMDNHLVLKNVRMTYVTPTKQTVAATVETLDIRNPGTTLLSLMRDPKSEIKEAELPVADEIALHNLSFGPEPNITVRLRTFKGVAIETAAVKTLMSTAGDDDPKVALAIIYGLSYKEDSASGVKITSKALPFSLSPPGRGQGEGITRQTDPGPAQAVCPDPASQFHPARLYPGGNPRRRSSRRYAMA